VRVSLVNTTREQLKNSEKNDMWQFIDGIEKPVKPTGKEAKRKANQNYEKIPVGVDTALPGKTNGPFQPADQ
jgi:hypothetical protein